MHRRSFLLSFALFTLTVFQAPATLADNANPRVRLDTSLGTVTLELFQQQAPVTVNNFLRYVNEGFYDGTIFHRVIAGFMIQGGGFTPELARKETHAPIRNEASPQLPNRRGTIAMARTRDPHSATAQFFINVVDNPFLNRSLSNHGYAVFGRVVEGMEVVDRIAAVPTRRRGAHQNVPTEAVIIRRAEQL